MHFYKPLMVLTTVLASTSALPSSIDPTTPRVIDDIGDVDPRSSDNYGAGTTKRLIARSPMAPYLDPGASGLEEGSSSWTARPQSGTAAESETGQGNSEGPIQQNEGPVQQNGGPIQQNEGPVQQNGGPIQQNEGPIHQNGGPIHQNGGPIQQNGERPTPPGLRHVNANLIRAQLEHERAIQGGSSGRPVQQNGERPSPPGVRRMNANQAQAQQEPTTQDRSIPRDAQTEGERYEAEAASWRERSTLRRLRRRPSTPDTGDEQQPR